MELQESLKKLNFLSLEWLLSGNWIERRIILALV
tara:strand:+ start:275 stop:376 length:102 start_codon:yes stop_codon:yes gene_type:complete